MAPSAFASELVSSKPGEAEVRRVKTFVTSSGVDQIIVEQAQITSDADYLAWIRAFPSRPQIQEAEPGFFRELAKQTQPVIPSFIQIQEDVFKPSLVLGIYRQLFSKKTVAEVEEEAIILNMDSNDFSILKGEVISSTISQTRSFPKDLEQWFDENELVVSPGNRRKLMQYCELGWYLVYGLVDTSAIKGGSPGSIPAIQYAFDSEELVHPSLLISSEDVMIEYWTLGEAPLVPSGRILKLDGRANKAVSTANQFEVSYQQALTEKNSAGTSLEEFISFERPQHLLRGKLNPGSAIQRVQIFEKNSQMARVPENISRGNFQDLLFSLLLGIAPVFLLPESWLLYWLRHQGKLERTRVNPNPVATKIWPLYCIGISIFWMVSQAGAGKIALILPLLFGLLSLRTQETPEGRVVVSFKKPKKTVRSSNAPKS